jgi:DNA-binding SARP family transcriptional activator
LLRLRTFGGLSIERTDGTSLHTTPTTARRRLAVLAVIAASGSRGIARDRLLAMFWPESDTDRARHSLDQTLYALKRDAGGIAVITGRDELTVNQEVLTSDIAEFDGAVARGEHETVVTVHRGPFLDGVYVPGAPEFDQWVDAQRSCTARELERAIEQLATSAAARGDHITAARWWQRLATMDMRNTRVVLALMTELAATGDRAGALRHAQIHETLVRDDLGAEPNPAVAALAEKIRSEPTVEKEHVIEPAAHSSGATSRRPDAVPTAAAPATPVRAAHDRRLTTWLGELTGIHPRAAGIAAIVLAVGLLSAAGMLATRHADVSRPWIVAANFENRTGDSIFDRALDAALATGLQQSSYANLFPEARVRQTLARMERPATTGRVRLDENLAREVALREGIHMVVAGAIDRVDSNYIITARLVDAASAATINAERRVVTRRSEIIDAMDDVVRRLRRDIGESADALKQHDLPLPSATTRSLDALRKYADGMAAHATGDEAAATALWEEAVAYDSNFALAHAALGIAYYFSNDRPRGDAHFTRALELVDRLTDRERFIVRASVESWRGNRERAIELRRALLAEYPGDPSAWGQIGYDYLRLGRSRDAIDAFQRQIARDTTEGTDFINLATAYKEAGEYDKAINAYRHAFARQPSMLHVPNLNHEFGNALVLAGRLDDARMVFDTMRTGDPLQRAQGERSLGLLSMLLGQYDQAIGHFRQAVLLSESRQAGLTLARNCLFLASAEREKGWTDSVHAQLRAVHALFRHTYFEPTFLMYLTKDLARAGELQLAGEVLDTLKARVSAKNPIDEANLLVGVGEIALAKGQADSAVRTLRVAAATDTSTYVAESLAHALAAAGVLDEAARRYDGIASAMANWYGWEGEQFGLVAPLSAAELYERLGDRSRARTAYERQVAVWTKPDSDLVPLRRAQAGLKRLRALDTQRETRR